MFVECPAEDNHSANLNEEIETVIEEVPCIVERKSCVPSRDEKESFRNKNKVSKESNGSLCPARGNCGAWQSTDSQTNRIGEMSRQID